jgi:hypothetical protein
MEPEFEALSSVTLANLQDIEKLHENQTTIEKELAHLRDMVRSAFKQCGVDFDKEGAFVSSKVPTLDLPNPTEPVLIPRQKLIPIASGTIPLPIGGAGD